MSKNPLLKRSPVGGVLLEWRLADPEAARTAATETPGGLSFLQIDHVVAASAKQAAGDPHSGTATGVTQFDEPLDRAAMAAALTDFVRRHEELRTVYGFTDGNPVRTLAPPALVEFETLDTGVVAEGAELLAHIVHRVENEAIFDRMPGVVFGAADADDRFTFYLGADHAHTDGFSLMLALDEITRLYRAHHAGGTVDLAPAPGFTEQILREKQIAASVTPDDPQVQEWRDILSATGGDVPGFPLDLGITGDEIPIAARSQRWVLTAEQLDRIDDRIRGTNVTFTGVVYAALAAAHHELTGEESYFTATVLSTRDEQTARTQGWMCNFAPIAFAVPSGTGFVDLAHAATEAVQRARRLNEIPVHATLAVLAAEGAYRPRSGSPQMVSYIDFRRVPGRDDPAVGNSEYFAGLGRTQNANMWVNRFEDELELAAQLPDNDTARENVGRFHDAVEAWLVSFADDGDQRVGPAATDPVAGRPSARGPRT